MNSKTKQEILDEAYRLIHQGSFHEAQALVQLAHAMAGDVRRVKAP